MIRIQIIFPGFASANSRGFAICGASELVFVPFWVRSVSPLFVRGTDLRTTNPGSSWSRRSDQAFGSPVPSAGSLALPSRRLDRRAAARSACRVCATRCRAEARVLLTSADDASRARLPTAITGLREARACDAVVFTSTVTRRAALLTTRPAARIGPPATRAPAAITCLARPANAPTAPISRLPPLLTRPKPVPRTWPTRRTTPTTPRDTDAKPRAIAPAARRTGFTTARPTAARP